MTKEPNTPNDPAKQPLSAYGAGGRDGGSGGRQGLGNAFVMSLVRQVARSLGTLLVRLMTGGRR